MRHESAPKPRLTDADYRKDYLSDKIGVQKRLEWTEKKYFVTTEEEPLFDAADVLRFGKDGAENITKFPFGPEHNIIKN